MQQGRCEMPLLLFSFLTFLQPYNLTESNRKIRTLTSPDPTKTM